jgi:hypothetical protein
LASIVRGFTGPLAEIREIFAENRLRAVTAVMNGFL